MKARSGLSATSDSVDRFRCPSVNSTNAVAVLRPHMPPTEAILPYLRDIEASGHYSNFGPLNTRLELALAARFGPRAQVCTVANATIGLALALSGMGVGERDLCLCPSFTFVATAHAILQVGAIPVFMDVRQESWALDPADAKLAVSESERLLGRRPTAVIVVSPFGLPLDLTPWLEFQNETGVKVLIDAAAQFDTACDARLPTVISLHATKVLGAGEGGFLVTNDPELFRTFRKMSTFGFSGSRVADCASTNAKLSEYAAAVGLASLNLWEETRGFYQEVSLALRKHLLDVPKIVFQSGWGSNWVTSVCVIETRSGTASELSDFLKYDGIETRFWWGAGCHNEPAFSRLPKLALPNTDYLAGRLLGIPFSATISDDQIERVVDGLKAYISRNNA